MTSPEQLQIIGAKEAFLLICARVDSAAWFRQLEALAGAEAGVKKSLLSPEHKTRAKGMV